MQSVLVNDVDRIYRYGLFFLTFAYYLESIKNFYTADVELSQRYVSREHHLMETGA